MKLVWKGDVGWENGITSEKVRADLERAGGEDIFVELTTMGGDYFEAAPIFNALEAYPGKKTVFYNGVVASAGTFIAMGFDKRIARPTSLFMVHNVQGGVSGDHNQFRREADLQEKLSGIAAELYSKISKKDISTIKNWMDGDGNGTWFMGAEILEAGFADEMEEAAASQSPALHLYYAQNEYKKKVAMWSGKKVAMRQNILLESKNNAERLVSDKKIDYDSPWSFNADDEQALLGESGDDWETFELWHLIEDDALAEETRARYKYPYGKNGMIFRSALRSIAARASAQGLSDLSEWASVMIKKIDTEREMRVTKEAVFLAIRDNKITADEIEAAIPEIGMRSGLKELGVGDPVEEIVKLRKELLAVEKDRVAIALTAEFGVDEESNYLRKYANSILGGVKLSDLQKKIEDFKADPVAKKLASDRLDPHNNVLAAEKKEHNISNHFIL